MKLKRHPSFIRAFTKRVSPNKNLTARVDSRIQMFLQNPRHPLLRDHPLKGSKEGYRAFWITGDIRIIYLPTSKDEVIFFDIGTHNQVY